MKIVYIASFPPRRCGIATFTQNLSEAIGANLQVPENPIVVALNDQEKKYQYSEDVNFVIRQEVR